MAQHEQRDLSPDSWVPSNLQRYGASAQPGAAPVLGHEGCGAVTAALEADPHEPVVVRLMLAKIVPALRGLQREDVTRGVEANVRQTVTMLKETPGLDREIQAGRLIIVGGIYSLADGRVRRLGNESTTP